MMILEKDFRPLGDESDGEMGVVVDVGPRNG